MKTLILKHGGHEAHVPYELPVEDWFDVFVPGHGVCSASVLLRTEDIRVEEVTPKDQGPLPDAIPGAENHPVVIEQAGDVCAVFETALCAQTRSGDVVLRNAEPHVAEDAKVLSTIAEMAHLESDLHTAWCRLPARMRGDIPRAYGPRGPDDRHHASRYALHHFIHETLVERAQDMATAAAKRREAEWNEDEFSRRLESLGAHSVDLAIDLAKERA